MITYAVQVRIGVTRTHKIWYQLLWVFIASGCTYLAYLIVERRKP